MADKARYYFINQEARQIMHFAKHPDPEPEGFSFCGLSGMMVRAAAGYYARNQEGFTIINGDHQKEKQDVDHVS